MSSPFTEPDLRQLDTKGISLAEAERQLDLFTRGFQPAELVRPCTVGDGILPIEASGQIPGDSPLSILAQSYAEFIASGEAAAEENRIKKFVPASGAATRMFRDLQWACKPEASFDDARNADCAVADVLERKSEFAFYEEWDATAQRITGNSLDALHDAGELSSIFRTLLTDEGLNYQNLPKALLKFHRGENPRTPLDEHLVETMALAGPDGELHCTVSEEHCCLFEQHPVNIRTPHPRMTLSVQDPSTDTIVVTPEHVPARDEGGRLVFRPGGHGALLRNLQRLQSEIVFIKNIDNVIPEALAHETWVWSKLIIGVLDKTTRRVRDILTSLDASNKQSSLPSGVDTLEKEAHSLFGYEKTGNGANRTKNLFKYLNRPIRACGMVPNQGEPGGGPFWIRSQDGTISRQIVEKVQVDLDSEDQAAIWRASTHFNPVLIACGLNDYQGTPFVLEEFVDECAGIINRRESDGHETLAIELPGLWNGSMSDWLTIFVEVPISNFNPVKTILDLLRPVHIASRG
ncbi:MAG: DUF4301 family protein [Planctomycetota bacterium]|jgi:hypothetical protein|nr:DUF4301 family protein [Planctomycetota bacterium]